MNIMNNMNIKDNKGKAYKPNINKVYLIVILSLLWIGISPNCYAKNLHKEAEYQKIFCNAYNGVMEVRLKDYTRIDCLTDTHAIEFDFAKKWAESVGQSLYYSLKSGKKAGIVIIMENPVKDKSYLKRVKDLAQKYNIDVWTMTGLTIEHIKEIGQ